MISAAAAQPWQQKLRHCPSSSMRTGASPKGRLQ